MSALTESNKRTSPPIPLSYKERGDQRQAASLKPLSLWGRGWGGGRR
jgi:hypothetical protein